ncbi:MAG TPA: hypothetical protein VHM88_22700 [Candidatus Acidoferrales bacterium]|nr:hypothetical protein [Candidatus Acidoferrales bacterium]
MPRARQLIATRQQGWAFQIAEIYAFGGETDAAWQWIDGAYRQRDGSGLLFVKIERR